jgi:hypothetical protein
MWLIELIKFIATEGGIFGKIFLFIFAALLPCYFYLGISEDKWGPLFVFITPTTIILIFAYIRERLDD